MSASFFFYDLETSGINPRSSRIMQFAGQRTDLYLKPVGEPEILFITLSPDILPDPDAILLTGITPQMTMQDGLAEADFAKYFIDEIATPGTIFVGYNTVRFDDEFMRNLLYRNFHDAYEWQWQDGKSRWDLLDVVRMTRALRPDGIEWPFDAQGKPTNRLELLTALNKLSHEHAHDALSDVYATIEIARLIRNKQERLFEYLLQLRDKNKVAELVDSGQPFVYTSGRYPSQFEKTTIAVKLCENPKQKSCPLVYDLRFDPEQYFGLSAEQLADKWRHKKGSDEPRLPVKKLQYNKCPAVAPLQVLDAKSAARLQISQQTIQQNHKKLISNPGFAPNVSKACELLDKQFQGTLFADERHVDGQLYDGFIGNHDKQVMSVVRAAATDDLSQLIGDFEDERLKKLLPLYKARNFPRKLSGEERTAWDAFCKSQLLGGGDKSRMAQFLRRLQDITAHGNLTEHQQYILEELKLYAESVMPEPEY
jgi:exodeoxyribonuclease-1